MAGVDRTKDAADQNFDYMFKLLIIGNSSVGKTSFLFRYADDSFTSAFVSTVGIDFKVKTVFRHDKRVKLQIWAVFERLVDIICDKMSDSLDTDPTLMSGGAKGQRLTDQPQGPQAANCNC
ncbi:unnamed protein product [Brassicogethes aeneus]|uniref:Uncharacterized protein n=1 Tax=Brassicogethes aeneus TaxID=1431903 RepID=A0A9P0FHI7_BRAAE|nr:unnamed protein product [Brassicogethes aeneus]